MTVVDKTEYCTFRELLDCIEPDLIPVCKALRDVICRLHPAKVEVIWKKQKIASYGVGSKKLSEHYAYIAPYKKHVNLGFYHGASIADKSGLLEGTGKRLRHIKIRSIAEANNRKIKRLLADSIADREATLNEP